MSCIKRKGNAYGAKKTYVLRFAWAEKFSDVRNVIYALGEVDVIAVPGMTVTKDSHTVSVKVNDRVTKVTVADAAAFKIEISF